MARPARVAVAKDAADRLLLRLPDRLATTADSTATSHADEENGDAAAQFARFAGVCRTFAPDLSADDARRGRRLRGRRGRHPGRRVRLSATSATPGATISPRNNKGRPFVLVGHSQGTLMLQQLIAHEIEGKPARQADAARDPARLQSARAAGQARRRHAEIDADLRTAPAETGCVHDLGQLPREECPARRARSSAVADQPGMTVACTNPARPGATGWARLDSYWYANSILPVPGGPIRWSSEGPPPTPFLRTEGLVSAPLRQRRPARLSVGPHQRRPRRTSAPTGSAARSASLGMFIPGWGMHLADMAWSRAT